MAALATGAVMMTLASPVVAQVRGSIGLQNTYRLRGYAVSGGRPVTTLDLYYDHPSGLYVNFSGLATLGHEATPEALGYIANLGYARRIGPVLVLDGGVVRTQFSHHASGINSGSHYTDLYVGLVGRGLSAHVHYSPDYYGYAASTLYGEIDGAASPAEKWQVSGHIGVLGYLDYPAGHPGYRFPRAARYDWRAGVSRQLGRVSLHADLSGGAPLAKTIYRPPTAHQGTALTIGALWVF